MKLSKHLATHAFLGFLAGFITYLFFGQFLLSFTAGFVGGFAIDLDHLIDYFLVFGGNFKLDYFFKGYSYFKSGKMYILFHGFEYVMVLALLSFLINNTAVQTILVGLAFGILIHLITDIKINNIPFQTYWVLKRIKNNFDIKYLTKPDQYQKFLQEKQSLGF